MPPLRGKKRKSEQSTMSYDEPSQDLASQKVPTKTGEEASQESPFKKRKVGITAAQKQALIENIQLEITERARKLRSNYNILAQTLRTRVEIRVHRISRPLRNLTMGELVQTYSAQQQQQQTKVPTKGPPVPEKDASLPSFRRPLTTIPGSPARPAKRLRFVAEDPLATKLLTLRSSEISGGDKENDMNTIDLPKKKARAGPGAADISRNPGQVLSPASSNSRIAPRPPSPTKSSGIARPVSPTKMATATNMLSNMVEKARSTRAAATNRKTTTSTTSSSTTGSTAARAKRGAVAAPPPTRPATRTARRVSAISESSDGSTSTVVRKRPATAMAGTVSKAPAAKRTVMSTIKKGVGAGTATTKKAPVTAAAKSQATSATGTGRVLRKRT
ncbi:hypothetical protein OQA88_6705 [Cercophora sp. LCS_1]